MDLTHDPIDKILEALQERAKELNCLYQVDELLSKPDATQDDVFRGLLGIIPSGWQYTGACRARITVEESVYEPPDFQETPWVQSAPIVVQGRAAGRLDVYYVSAMPRSDEGPFLKEERKLIDTVAERIAHYLTQRRLQGALREWDVAHQISAERKQDWWVIIEFLRFTDRHLLIRLSRKMLNHLCWNGIEEAQSLLRRFAPDQGTQEDVTLDDNRPVEKKTLQDLLLLTEETFRIAASHLSEAEIVSRIQKWIKDDKSSFLLDALENPGSTVTEIAEAIQRFRFVGVEPREMTRPVQMAMNVSLVRRFFSDELDFINTAKSYVGVNDFFDLAQRIICPPNGHGKLGGKSSGLFLASKIVQNATEYADLLSDIKVPRTWYITSDGLLNFIQYNHLEDVYNRKYLELDQTRREYPHIVQVFKNSHFSPEIVKGLSMALDDFDERPLIVRSSSLLEDRMGAAFSGKYKSLFLANQGSKKERLAALQDAIAEVYASIFGPDPLEYRAERGLLDLHEEMGIMIQEVVGTKVGDYFLPAFSGVAFSNNEFRWSARIKRDDGLLRLVPGLGTRAVDRMVDDYPILIAPGQPGLRVNVTLDEVVRYSPKMVDAINLRTRAFESVEVATLLREFGASYPLVGELVSIVENEGIRRPLPFQTDFEKDEAVVTFDGLASRTPFIARMRALLKLLQDKLGVPVDVEFAHDGTHLHLLQCRPQSYAAEAVSVPIPSDLPRDRVVFTANRYVSNGRVPDITHVVYVDPAKYKDIADLPTLREVGRAVGRLNKLLPKRQFILIGPGRWGSRGDVKLGVSVTYSEINNTAVLVEVARKDGNYVPDLSFGTHFFQDLVEAGIRYLPLYPDEPANVFNEEFLTGAPNILADLLPDSERLEDTIRVIDVPTATQGLVLKVFMNADQDRAAGVLASPSASPAESVADRRREAEAGGPDTHWRWRLRMSERIAAQLDPERFGVRGIYVFGSTKNATAGPASDIDLLVHFHGTEEQRRELETWLDGWSRCLSEMNFLRTGARSDGLLDVHIVTNDDVARQTSYAAKIGAVTDAARPLRLLGAPAA
jgi:pyruvate, water dikinase